MVLLALAALLACCAQQAAAGPGRWLGRARIAAPELWVGMSDARMKRAIDELALQGVNAVDLDFSGEEIGEQVRMVERVLAYARSAHAGMRFFVYQAPLESVSENVDMNRDGEVDPGKASTFSEHPEWTQRGLGGEPALLYGAEAGAFWVGKHDEDVWLCPNDPAYKNVWTENLRRLAAAGVDAIYIDVPFLRGWFDERRGWRWACACDDCRAIFHAQYGGEIPERADWGDPDFRRFVRFRFEQIENFIAAAQQAVRSGNASTKLIVEHWDGLADAVETGCDPALIARRSDARCHEWTNADGSSSGYHEFSWAEDLVRYMTYRALDGVDPTWMLAYSDSGDTAAMKTLASLQLTAGCNFWETDEPDMQGSADSRTRTELFTWIAANEAAYYNRGIEPYANAALYYSRDSIVFHDFRKRMEPWRCASEFFGTGMMLLQLHIPFRVVTSADPETLSGIELLILPNIACLGDAEAQAIVAFVEGGGAVIATGDTGAYDSDGERRPVNALEALAPASVLRTSKLYGYAYYNAAAPWDDRPASRSKAEKLRGKFERRVLAGATVSPLLTTDAGPSILLIPFRERRGLQLRQFSAAAGGALQSFNVRLRLLGGGRPASASMKKLLASDAVPVDILLDGESAVFEMNPGVHAALLIRIH